MICSHGNCPASTRDSYPCFRKLAAVSASMFSTLSFWRPVDHIWIIWPVWSLISKLPSVFDLRKSWRTMKRNNTKNVATCKILLAIKCGMCRRSCQLKSTFLTKFVTKVSPRQENNCGMKSRRIWNSSNCGFGGKQIITVSSTRQRKWEGTREN